VPRGTHDHRLFVEPEELRASAERLGLSMCRVQGESVDVTRTALRWAIVLRRSHDLSVGYSALFRKVSA
jgi:2-polyprenyl-3-methyl-5-hydroxy-6-metoxy-1,4-benzoquinol methylase